MTQSKADMGITKNIRVVEWLKTELISTVGTLFKHLLHNTEEGIITSVSYIIILAYVIGRRLGIDFCRVDREVKRLLRVQIDEKHEVEKWYSDFSEMLSYFNSKQR